MSVAFPGVLEAEKLVQAVCLSSGVALPAGPELAETGLTLGVGRADMPSASW